MRPTDAPGPDRRLLRLATFLMALSVLPHAWHLPLSVTAGFFLPAGIRLLLWPDPRPGPPRLLRLLLVAAAVGLVVHQAGLTDSRRFGVSLLVLMAGLKLLETGSRRDLFTLAFLGFFVLVTQFLFSTDALLTLGVLVLATGWVALLALAHQTPGRESPTRALRTALGLMAGSLPVMALLFFLFPRLEGPLWRLEPGGGAVTGMSDQLRMGTISRLGLLEEVAFRIRFEGPVPPPEARYWRGLVLWQTDGRTWKRVPAPPAPPSRPPPGALIHEITMEPSGRPWLFPLDRVAAAEAPLVLDRDGQLETPRPIFRRRSFRLASVAPPAPAPLTERERLLGLQLPPRVSQRVRDLARSWRRKAGADDAAVVRLALEHFRTRPFVYTLQPPRLEGDPVDAFLFETRQGFCEHYAASFVLLMRLAGIPARVVTGYQGGEVNPVGGHLVVRQSDAHAWAEVWLSEDGWTRVDPTAAVAPERVRRALLAEAAPVGSPARFRVEMPPGLVEGALLRLGWYRDHLQLLWHHWVVGYDRERQTGLLARLGWSRPDPPLLGLAAVAAALAAGGAVFFLRPPRTASRDGAAAAWRRFRRKLRRAGLALPARAGPLATARAAERRFPHRAGELRAIADLYIALRYGPSETCPEELRELNRRVRRLRL